MTRELSLFSYEILGLIGRDGAGPHDLRQMVERGRILAWAGESQYYAEPKRLAGLGYLKARKEPGKTRERTVYELTAKGRKALREWAATPAAMTPIRSEPLTRMLIADLVGDELTLEGLAGLRRDLASYEASIEEMRKQADTIPHRSRYLTMAIDLIEGILHLHSEWVDDVERELR